MPTHAIMPPIIAAASQSAIKRTGVCDFTNIEATPHPIKTSGTIASRYTGTVRGRSDCKPSQMRRANSAYTHHGEFSKIVTGLGIYAAS